MWNNKNKRGATPMPASPTRRPKTPAPEKQATTTEVEKKTVARIPKPSTTGKSSQHAVRVALHRIRQNRTASLLVVIVIATALLLPTGLQVLSKNVKSIQSSFQSTSQISLYLRKNVSESQAISLADTLKTRQDIKHVQYISPQQALDEFQVMSGFGDALSQLNDNPLPTVLVITPKLDQKNVVEFDQLKNEMERLPEVELAQGDTTWLERLFALGALFEKISILVTLFLVFAVLIVVGNTIRLQSQNYRDEIEVSKLVGATDNFVRLPFLYTGLFYGISGAALAVASMFLTLFWLDQNVVQLASLYQNEFHLQGLDLADMGMILSLGGLLGLGGSWIAVNRFLHQLNL